MAVCLSPWSEACKLLSVSYAQFYRIEVFYILQSHIGAFSYRLRLLFITNTLGKAMCSHSCAKIKASNIDGSLICDSKHPLVKL